MKIGLHDVALPYMKNVCDKYPDHAFGQLYVSRCCAALGDPASAAAHAAKATAIFERDAWWRSLAERYGVDYIGRRAAGAKGAGAAALGGRPAGEACLGGSAAARKSFGEPCMRSTTSNSRPRSLG